MLKMNEFCDDTQCLICDREEAFHDEFYTEEFIPLSILMTRRWLSISISALDYSDDWDWGPSDWEIDDELHHTIEEKLSLKDAQREQWVARKREVRRARKGNGTTSKTTTPRRPMSKGQKGLERRDMLEPWTDPQAKRFRSVWLEQIRAMRQEEKNLENAKRQLASFIRNNIDVAGHYRAIDDTRRTIEDLKELLQDIEIRMDNHMKFVERRSKIA